MSDSQPPYGGPDPYDGWDLEGLLSGESVWLPDGMRPVAATLSALRGAPMPAELAAEASARAEFRRAMLVGQGGPPAPLTPAGNEHTLNGHTLILPARAADGGPPVGTRPRHSHRRPPRRGRWQPKALAGVAAAAVVIGGIALAGGFSGAAGHPGQPGQSSGVAGATTPAGSASAGPGLEGSAAKVPTAHPTPSASGQQSSSGSLRSTLCRQYWAFFAHPEASASWAAEKASLRQLSDMAGSPWNINRYCMPYYQWGFAPPAQGASHGNDQDGLGSPGPGNSQGNNQAAPGSGNQNGGNGAAGKGNSGNGAGNGKSPHGNGRGLGSDNQK